MTPLLITNFVVDVLVVLTAGLLAGVICRRLGISMLVGYLLVGALIGHGGLGLVSQEHHELEYLAHAGALLLLFAIGIEFSLEELARISRYFFVGGSVQMLFVALPVLAIFLLVLGMPWRPAVLMGAAAALSSTVLVFKALAETGQTASPHGRRAIAILLFQDVALIPLMLLVPVLAGGDDGTDAAAVALLIAESVLFVAAVIVARKLVAAWMIPHLANLRSVELVILFALTVLVGACQGAAVLDLPPAIGAFAAGLVLSGNRLTQQIDTLLLPYRESFAAVFFVTLGTLLRPGLFLEEPLLLIASFLSVVALKAAAAGFALRLVGLDWRAALGMGLGLSQLGEFSFVLLSEGVRGGVIEPEAYSRMLFVALGTLVVTPQLLRLGLRWTGTEEEEIDKQTAPRLESSEAIQKALVIGLGPIGRHIASRLEILGIDVHLLDLSPVNIYPFFQQGFHTVAGDARDPEVLNRARVQACRLVVVSVPDDQAAIQITKMVVQLNPTCSVAVRCRFLENTSPLKKAGATAVISEEAEASNALLRICEKMIPQTARGMDR